MNKKIEVGQRWRAYDGTIGIVRAVHFGGRCWLVDEADGKGWSVSASGKAAKGFPNMDLKELIQNTEVR